MGLLKRKAWRHGRNQQKPEVLEEDGKQLTTGSIYYVKGTERGTSKESEKTP